MLIAINSCLKGILVVVILNLRCSKENHPTYNRPTHACWLNLHRAHRVRDASSVAVVGAFSSCSIEAVEAKPFNLNCLYPLDLFSELRNAAEAFFALAGVTTRP